MKPLYEGYEKLVENGKEFAAEAYERVMAAHPERKRFHPSSMGACLQMEGWSDQEIADKVWLRNEDRPVEADNKNR